MKITETDVKVLLNFLDNFDISNSDWGIDFIKRLNEEKPKPLTNYEKTISDWEE
jgi:hypothetical protein